MIQAIAGVTPPEVAEVTIMTVWPSIAASGLGKSMGKLYINDRRSQSAFTVAKIWMLLTIPLALGLYLIRLLPFSAKRYRLTNRRLIIEKGLLPRADSFVQLSDFDTVQVEVQPGQEWYHAGDLVFLQGKVETFRLFGVSRPEAFRQVCLKAQRSHSSVARVMAHA